jgi:hypothetical protein
MAVESLVFASNWREYATCSSIVAILPAVVVHTGVAITVLLTRYLLAITGYYSVYESSVPGAV